MKRILKSLMLVIIMIISITTIVKVEATTTAPTTITMGTGEVLPSYIGQTYFSTKITSDGKFAYCVDMSLKTPNNLEMQLVESKDAGIAYIMTNGYPAKSITGNAKYDYYITQTALWWYLDDTAGGTNLSNSFKETGDDSYGLRKYVISLKEAAKKEKEKGYSTPSLNFDTTSTEFTLSEDRKYYYSSDITVQGQNLTGKITLKLENAPASTTIVDANGNAITTVTSGAKVRVRVLATEVSNLENNITIKATATGKTDKAYMYKPTSDKYQPVVMSILFSETETVNANKKLTLKTNKLEITKIDSETKEILPGAKLQLIDEKGSIVDTWVTTNKTHIINHLQDGKYTLTEIEAPSGYKLNNVGQTITIKNGTVTKINFENTKQPTILEIIKKDQDSNKTLAGATFVLKDYRGLEIYTWVSTGETKKLVGLPEGEYIIEELNAPSGYIKSNEQYKVKLEAGKTKTITVYNKKEIIDTESVLKIMKVNGETGEPLANAQLILKDINGNEIISWSTTTEEFVINNIQPGKYYLSELEAPNGFVLSEETLEINITEDGGTVIVTFYNTPEIEVPDTATSISKMTITLGLIVTFIGGSIIFKTLRKEEN